MIDPWLDISHVRGRGRSSSVIGWFGGGVFSHVDIVVPNWYCERNGLKKGSLLGARSDTVGGQPPGVYIRPPNYETWLKRLVLRVPCTAAQAEKGFLWATSQLKAPYDLPGLIESFVLGRDWRQEGAWWCSELAVRTLEVGGVISELPLPYTKITPGDSALICSAARGRAIYRMGMENRAA